MFTFCAAKSRKDVFSDDDFIYEHWLVITASWEDLAAVVSVSNKYMSPCVICVVIAREIFLLQSDCSEITKCITNLKTTIKTEILPLNVVDDQWPVGVCSVPSECLSAKICCSWSSTNLWNAQLASFFFNSALFLLLVGSGPNRSMPIEKLAVLRSFLTYFKEKEKCTAA